MGASKRNRIIRNMLSRQQAGLCLYCLRKTQIDKQWHPLFRTLDHVIPKTLGGRSHISNLVVACRECNHDFGSSTWNRDESMIEWYRSRLRAWLAFDPCI